MGTVKNLQAFFSHPIRYTRHGKRLDSYQAGSSKHLRVITKYFRLAADDSSVFCQVFLADDTDVHTTEYGAKPYSKKFPKYVDIVKDARIRGLMVEARTRKRRDVIHKRRNHSKSFLFERLNDDRPWMQQHVIFTGSANMHPNSENKHQCMVRFSSERMFEAFKKRHSQIEAFRKTKVAPDYFSAKTEYYGDTNSEIRILAHFLPLNSDGNLYRQILRQVTKDDTARIWLVSPQWGGTDNEVGVARELCALAAKGAEIKLITRKNYKAAGIHKNLWNVLDKREGAFEWRVLGDSGFSHLHSRYLVIDARYKGVRDKIVWMGTPNMKVHSFTESFETLLKIRDAQHEAFNSFVNNFKYLWGFSKHPRRPSS